LPLKEKLEIVIGAAEPRLRAGLPRRLRRRNAFELFLEYSISRIEKIPAQMQGPYFKFI